ncbi:MAG: hypothetical protein HY951_19360 [Bacteroidia bacterium]|nr:hypothetical protein [Bacteroidia bacterium]
MKLTRLYSIFIFCWLSTFYSFAQTFNLPIDDNLPKCIEENYLSNPQNHSLIKPLQLDIINFRNLIDSCFSVKDKKKWLFDKDFIFFNKLSFDKDLNPEGSPKYGFYINPVLTDVSKLKDGFFTENGLTALTWFGKNLSANFTGTFIYTQPKYKGKYISYDDVFLPHFGKANLDSSTSSYSYLNLTGYLSWQVADFMNLQVGRDKVFFGDGYRSLFVSDNSNAYPFFKGTVDIWKVKYTILYSSLNEKDSLSATDFKAKKYSASHILSWNIGKRLNFNMFETVIWRGKDSLGNRGFDVNYLNPIIFYRPVEFSLGSPDNVIMGFGGRLRIFKTTHLYGQFLLDEFKLSELKAKRGWWGNKYGIQAGIKTYRLFGVENLYAMGEVNVVRPFTYSHGSYMENNGNYSQPLAHPLGANFVEGIANIRYRLDRWQINSILKKYVYGADYNSLNMGFDIYRSYNDNKHEFNNTLLQGQKYKITSLELSLGYILNPKWMLAFNFGFRFDFISFQKINLSPYNEGPFDGYAHDWNQFIFFGLSTNIGNREWLY